MLDIRADVKRAFHVVADLIGVNAAAIVRPTDSCKVIEPATLWERLPRESQQAVRQYRDGTVPADVAADITRAGGLDYTWWLGERPRPAAGDWRMRPSFVAYVDQIGADEAERRKDTIARALSAQHPRNRHESGGAVLWRQGAGAVVGAGPLVPVPASGTVTGIPEAIPTRVTHWRAEVGSGAGPVQRLLAV